MTTPAVPMPEYADGTWTHVLEAQRSGTVEQIVVHNGVPMGPRGFPGATGPTGPKGESTEWNVGRGDPPDPNLGDHEVGEIYLDMATGDVYVLGRNGWFKVGNLNGPTGPIGDTGPPANMEIGVVLPGAPGEAAAWLTGDSPDYTLSFIVPAGPTGPRGGPPALETLDTHIAPVGTEPDVRLIGGSGFYLMEWWLPQGDTGPAGTNITIVGEVQPSPTVGPPPPAGGTEQPGNGYIDMNGDIWVWTGTEWINVGPIVGPTGPPGPPGGQQVQAVLPLNLEDNLADPSGLTVSQTIYYMDAVTAHWPYPFVRVLYEPDPVARPGVYTDATGVYVEYNEFGLYGKEVRIVLDDSMFGATGKVVLS